MTGSRLNQKREYLWQMIVLLIIEVNMRCVSCEQLFNFFPEIFIQVFESKFRINFDLF